ncbi:hypothetical protein J7E50_25850 [Pedobacter sp. ISL-68]|uniref:tetratricopeptide repeat protein n=1 Tax=unclassified Pedobacter TaxID=2628915 RepID=UPI001BE93A24|nr:MULTISPECIES: hypothetical protein [unclassified Pedobacter]MBT2564666.1 hypothetical protein [Pedobacter sp. ISL-64]MBT2593665.1 hypothetical protein [Pedobacter sp. ISL-68]
MFKLSLIIFVILFTNSAFAQKPVAHNEIDARIFEADKTLINSGSLNEFIKTTQQIIRDSKQISYSEGIASTCIAIANAYNRAGDFGKAEDYLKQAQNEDFVKTSEKFMADINFVYGQRYMMEKLYEKAIESFRKMLTPEVISDYDLYAAANSEISTCLSKLKLRDSAYIYRKRAYQALLKVKDPIVRMNLAVIANNIAVSFIQEKKNDSAKFYLEIATKFANESKEPYAIATTNSGWAYYYRKNKKSDSAIILLKSNVATFKKLNLTYELRDVYNRLQKAYTASHNEKEANQYLNLHKTLSDSINKKNNLAVVVKSISEKEQQTFDNEKKKMRYLIGVIVVSILLVSTLGFYKFRMYRKTQKNIIKEKNALLNSISETKCQAEIDSLGFLLELAKAKDPAFLIKFNEFYPTFKEKMLTKFPDLSLNDLEFCAYLRMNLDTKEIARFANISVRSVESRKYRLRKKFNISSSKDINLVIFNS